MFIVKLLQQGLVYFLINSLTGKFLGDIIIYTLDKIAKKTNNTVDDDLVAMLRRAFNNEPYREEKAEQLEEPGPENVP